VGVVVAAGALSLGAAAIFWLPLVTEVGYVRVDQWTTSDYDVRANFVYPHQLLSPLWGYGVSLPGPDDKVSFQVGLVPFALALFAVAGAFWLRHGGRPALRVSAQRRADLGFFALAALAAALFMLPSALPAWEALRVPLAIQFPWRLLTVTTLGLSLAGGAAGLYSRGGLGGQVALATFAGAALLASYPYLQTPEETFRPAAEGPVSLAGLMRFQQSSGEMVGLTRWNTEKPVDSPLFYVYLQGIVPDDKVDRRVLAPDAQVATTRHTTVLDEVAVRAPSGTALRFLTQHYPGWTAYVDGRPVPITPSEKLGLISIDVPPGEHSVRLVFEETWPRRLGTALTLTTLVGLAGYGVWHVVRRRRAWARR
jgi:hypothetical protein